MKYVMLKTTTGGVERLWPIIFPNEVVHNEVYRAMIETFRRHGWAPPRVESAGFVQIHDITCCGDSKTLGAVSKGKADADIIMAHDYRHGIL